MSEAAGNINGALRKIVYTVLVGMVLNAFAGYMAIRISIVRMETKLLAIEKSLDQEIAARREGDGRLDTDIRENRRRLR